MDGCYGERNPTAAKTMKDDIEDSGAMNIAKIIALCVAEVALIHHP
jgi:hypothetical protein